MFFRKLKKEMPDPIPSQLATRLIVLKQQRNMLIVTGVCTISHIMKALHQVCKTPNSDIIFGEITLADDVGHNRCIQIDQLECGNQRHGD